jgi:hypothetical protein
MYRAGRSWLFFLLGPSNLSYYETSRSRLDITRVARRKFPSLAFASSDYPTYSLLKSRAQAGNIARYRAHEIGFAELTASVQGG